MWQIAVLPAAAFLVLWTGSWVAQRSLNSPRKHKEFLAWLDEKLGTDTSVAKYVDFRFNLLRDSRLTVNGMEIEHPNVLFPGRFLALDWGRVWCPPLAAWGVHPGRATADLRGAAVRVEQNDHGEWSVAGLMQPSFLLRQAFPFREPSLSGWSADVLNSAFFLTRNNREFKLDVNARLEGNLGNGRIILKAGTSPFSMTDLSTGASASGTLGLDIVSGWLAPANGSAPAFAPDYCEGRVEKFPVSFLPFLFRGMPAEGAPGEFSGTVRLLGGMNDAGGPGRGTLQVEGRLADCPLGVLGLARDIPLQASLPLESSADGSVRMHFGPAGFGGVDVAAPVAGDGTPGKLAIRGDMAVVDNLSPLFSRDSAWLKWLTSTFSGIDWASSKWRAFDWTGSDFLLRLARSTAGLNLTGEAELMGGRVHAAMVPGSGDAFVTVAGDGISARQFVSKALSGSPEAWRIPAGDGNVNFTWRGLPGPQNDFGVWEFAMVLGKTELSLREGGDWWRGLSRAPALLADEARAWNGRGDVSELEKLAAEPVRAWNQISVVARRENSGMIRAEFVAHDENSDETIGWLEGSPRGGYSGELSLGGTAILMRAAGTACPELGAALGKVAQAGEGLRVLFRVDGSGAARFSYPFLDQARRLAGRSD